MIRVVIADDQTLIREGMVSLLNSISQVQVVGQAGSGDEALQLTRELNPDIVLLEVALPGMGGLEATQRISSYDKFTAVIALTSCTQAPFPAQMLKAGALGYLTKQVSVQELEKAIKRVFLGKRYVCHSVAQDLASYAVEDHVQSPFEQLSHREMQIMLMVISCQKVSEISGSLHLSPKTVNSYRYRIFEKLKVKSDVELVLLAVQHGVLPRRAEPLAGPKHTSGLRSLESQEYLGRGGDPSDSSNAA